MARRGNKPVAVVITKPPESTMFCVGPDRSGNMKFLFFDSHQRPVANGRDIAHIGAHIFEFNRMEDLQDYIVHLYAVDPSVRDQYLYTVCDATFFTKQSPFQRFLGGMKRCFTCDW